MWRHLLKGVSKITFATYYGYNDISLRLFVDVVNTGKFELLCKSKAYDYKKCMLRWEEILSDNAKTGDSHKFGLTIDSYKAYIKLTAKFYNVVAMLLTLQFKVNYQYIAELNDLGYVIDVSSSEKYAASIARAFNKAKNINSKIESKKIEIATLSKPDTIEPTALDFDVLISTMSVQLGYQVSEKISLSSYNAYGVIIKKRNDEHRK